MMRGYAVCRSRLEGLPGFAAAALGLVLAVAVACGCGRHEDLAGRYEALSHAAGGQVTHTLELQADGKGFWSVDSDNAPLRWDVHKNTIRLHTPAGGVVQGTLDRGSLRISMPGQGVIQFTKVR